MLDWIKSVLESARPLENPHKLSDELLAAIGDGLSLVNDKSNTFREKALRYVVDDSGADVPALIAGAHGPGYSWSSNDHDAVHRQARWKVYDHWDQLPADLLLRLGTVLAASSPALRYQCRLDIGQKFPWVDAYVLDLLGLPVTHGSDIAGAVAHKNASMSRLEALLEFSGAPRAELVASAFRSGRAKSWVVEPVYVSRLQGFGESAARHADLIRGAFRAKSFEHRTYAVKLLQHCEAAHLAAFAEELVALSVDSSAQVRSVAAPLALCLGQPALTIARKIAVEGKPEQRGYALRLLWDTGGAEAREFVLARGETDPADRVRELVPVWKVSAEVANNVPTELRVPSAEAELNPSLSVESQKALAAALAEINDFIKAAKRKEEESNPRWKRNPKPLSDSDLDSVVRQVAESVTADALVGCSLETYHCNDKAIKLFKDWCSRADVRLGHVVKLLRSIGAIRPAGDRRPSMWGLAPVILNTLGRSGRASLLELHNLLEMCRLPVEIISNNWFMPYGLCVASGWPNEAIWPYFAAHRSMLDDALNPHGSRAADYSFSRPRVFDALMTFPAVPGDLVPMLFGWALGSGKGDRIGAQRVLERLPDKESRIIEALKSGKAENRIAAANWLAHLRVANAIPALEAALKKEKNDAAAGALMLALESLGVPVERFLDREGLVKDAAKALAKGVPADLVWLPLGSLPAVSWGDTGERIAPDLIKWLLVQSHKLKTPEPGGLLRKYCQHMRAGEREALAMFVLIAWLQHDVLPIPRAEAEKRARAAAQQTLQYVRNYPQYNEQSPFRNATEQQIFEAYLPAQLATPVGSAITSKGVLALVAACGGSEIAGVVQRYLKDWYGTRAAQGKALIQMLAWVEHPTATQLMLSIGSRFRTKSFQEEATRQAHLLAERRGWTLDELSDRTIPTAGFDENGMQTIKYPQREFTARLTAELDVELYNNDGKKIPGLPEARKDEDESAVNEAKKQFSAAKKEIKSVLQLQKDRLYEAVCTQRTWRFEDWDLYLNRHPIVRYYCQQLVWRACAPGGPAATFRPLDDGSLADAGGDPVSLAPDEEITIAHDTNTGGEVANAWLTHFRDFKVTALFQQFGKGTYKLAAERRDATELEDFKGHVLEAFALRGRASKLGYTRGSAEDGGLFFRYEKRFPTLAIATQVEFTGNSLPEENRTVALLALSFQRKAAEAGVHGMEKLSLGDVPAVLLSECWNDMRLMAADGKGFDPEWEKKAHY